MAEILQAIDLLRSHDPNEINEANSILMNLCEDPQSTFSWIELLKATTDIYAAKIAAISLSNSIKCHWDLFNDQQKEMIISVIIEILTICSNRVIVDTLFIILTNIIKKMNECPQVISCFLMQHIYEDPIPSALVMRISHHLFEIPLQLFSEDEINIILNHSIYYLLNSSEGEFIAYSLNLISKLYNNSVIEALQNIIIRFFNQLIDESLQYDDSDFNLFWMSLSDFIVLYDFEGKDFYEKLLNKFQSLLNNDNIDLFRRNYILHAAVPIIMKNPQSVHRVISSIINFGRIFIIQEGKTPWIAYDATNSLINAWPKENCKIINFLFKTLITNYSNPNIDEFFKMTIVVSLGAVVSKYDHAIDEEMKNAILAVISDVVQLEAELAKIIAIDFEFNFFLNVSNYIFLQEFINVITPTFFSNCTETQYELKYLFKYLEGRLGFINQYIWDNIDYISPNIIAYLLSSSAKNTNSISDDQYQFLLSYYNQYINDVDELTEAFSILAVLMSNNPDLFIDIDFFSQTFQSLIDNLTIDNVKIILSFISDFLNYPQFSPLYKNLLTVLSNIIDEIDDDNINIHICYICSFILHYIYGNEQDMMNIANNIIIYLIKKNSDYIERKEIKNITMLIDAINFLVYLANSNTLSLIIDNFNDSLLYYTNDMIIEYIIKSLNKIVQNRRHYLAPESLQKIFEIGIHFKNGDYYFGQHSPIIFEVNDQIFTYITTLYINLIKLNNIEFNNQILDFIYYLLNNSNNNAFIKASALEIYVNMYGTISQDLIKTPELSQSFNALMQIENITIFEIMTLTIVYFKFLCFSICIEESVLPFLPKILELYDNYINEEIEDSNEYLICYLCCVILRLSTICYVIDVEERICSAIQTLESKNILKLIIAEEIINFVQKKTPTSEQKIAILTFIEKFTQQKKNKISQNQELFNNLNIIRQEFNQSEISVE